jgi:hypothetical protein
LAQTYLPQPYLAASQAISELSNIWEDFGEQVNLQSDKDSTTYFFPGLGLAWISPNPLIVNNAGSRANVVIVHQVLSLQIEYGYNPPDSSMIGTCKMWASEQEDYALEICLSNYENESLILASTQ